MSYGSILTRGAHHARHRHETASAGKSNTGEGGEESDRYKPLPKRRLDALGDQAGGGRGVFGVTTEYLVNSDMMQIKIAQGRQARRGAAQFARPQRSTRPSPRCATPTPGVGLISPPPHHDIYSIEDLAQLIFDLKNVNPDGDVLGQASSPKVGVGTVGPPACRRRAFPTMSRSPASRAAPVLRRSPRSRHAGFAVGDRARRDPPDAGRQQVAAGGLRSKWTAAIRHRGATSWSGALLGADEFGFATAAAYRRRLHHDAASAISIPVRSASPPRTPVLRKRFRGQPEHVINYFFLRRRKRCAN